MLRKLWHEAATMVGRLRLRTAGRGFDDSRPLGELLADDLQVVAGSSGSASLGLRLRIARPSVSQ